MDKFELIDSIIVQIDTLIEMRGVAKCRVALDIVGKLAALKNGLSDDDKANEQRIEEYKRIIERLTLRADTCQTDKANAADSVEKGC